MTIKQAQKDKIERYLNGLSLMYKPQFFNIGVIIFAADSRDKVIDVVLEQGVDVIHAEDPHPDLVLRKMIEYIEGEKILALNIKDEIPGKIYNQLSGLRENVIDVQLVGDTEPTVINPVNTNSKLVLLMDEETYDSLAAEDIICSACRI